MRWKDTIGDAFLRCAKHFKVSKPQKQLGLFDNIYGQHFEKWPHMIHLWARYLPILANYEDIIQIDSFAYNWC